MDYVNSDWGVCDFLKWLTIATAVFDGLFLADISVFWNLFC